MISPCLATVMAPERVITTKQSLSLAIASSTSTASPSWRPVNAVSAMPRTSALIVLVLERSSGNTGESLSDTGLCSLRSIPVPWCFCFNLSPQNFGDGVNSANYKVMAGCVKLHSQTITAKDAKDAKEAGALKQHPQCYPSLTSPETLISHARSEYSRTPINHRNHRIFWRHALPIRAEPRP